MSTYTGVIAASQKPCNCGAARLTDLYIEQEYYYLTSLLYPIVTIDRLSASVESIDVFQKTFVIPYSNSVEDTARVFVKNVEIDLSLYLKTYSPDPKYSDKLSVTAALVELELREIIRRIGANNEITDKGAVSFKSLELELRQYIIQQPVKTDAVAAFPYNVEVRLDAI